MRFYEYIRQQRELLGLSQRDMAETVSVDVPMYSRYERGLRQVKESQIAKIASKLNLDYSELRKFWLADKVFCVISTEKDACQILDIVVENINQTIL